MAITLVGTNYAASSSASIPAHEVGDIILMSARRNNSATPPTIPGDFTTIFSTGNANYPGMSWGWKRADTTTETSGTWTNASSVFVGVYRGCKASGDVIGSGKQNSNATGTTPITWPGVTFDVTDGSSWGIAFGAINGSISGDADLNDDWGNMVIRRTSTVNLHAFFDSNGGVTGITSGNSGALGTSNDDWNVVCFELLAEPDGLVEVDLAGAQGAPSGTLAKQHRRALAGAQGAPSGVANRKYLKAFGGTQGAPTGTAATLYKKSLAGAQGAPDGDVFAYSSKSLAGSQDAPSGTIDPQAITSASVSGTQGAPSGVVEDLLKVTLAGAQGAPSGALTNILGRALAGLQGAPSGLLILDIYQALAGLQGAPSAALLMKQYEALAGAQGAPSGLLQPKQLEALAGAQGAPSGAFSLKKYLIALAGAQGAPSATVASTRSAAAAGLQLPPIGNIAYSVDAVGYLRPVGAGTYTTMTPSAGSNWENVDEVSADGMTTYNSATNATNYESYEHSGSPPDPDGSLTIHVRAVATAAFQSAIYACVVISGVTYVQFIGYVATSFTDYSSTFATNPATGNPWTQAQIDAADIGVLYAVNPGTTLTITQLYGTVPYSGAMRLVSPAGLQGAPSGQLNSISSGFIQGTQGDPSGRLELDAVIKLLATQGRPAGVVIPLIAEFVALAGAQGAPSGVINGVPYFPELVDLAGVQGAPSGVLDVLVTLYRRAWLARAIRPLQGRLRPADTGITPARSSLRPADSSLRPMRRRRIE